MSDQAPAPVSPNWGNNIKLIIGLTIVALIAALVIYFRTIIGPLLLSFLLAYLLHPVISRGSQLLRLSWRTSVNLVYILLLVFLISLVTIAGLAVVQQIQSLFNFVEHFINDLPELIAELSTKTYMIGPFRLDLSLLDLETTVRQILDLVQPVLGQAGNLIGRFAASAATTVWWGLFILLISYFLLSESGQVREQLVTIEIAPYQEDIQVLMRELTKIWNAFLRGQLIISILIVISYYMMLTLLGARLSLAIALLAGLASFVPYVGPFVAWVIAAIIAYFQAGNYFGLNSFYYAALVVLCCMALNYTFDSLINPRIMGRTLGVHPAGVMVSAIIAADLLGIIGLLLVAPVLASVLLVGRYIGRKMLDQDPWPPQPPPPPRPAPPWVRVGRRLQAIVQSLRRK